jgi:hypothetical protein
VALFLGTDLVLESFHWTGLTVTGDLYAGVEKPPVGKSLCRPSLSGVSCQVTDPTITVTIAHSANILGLGCVLWWQLPTHFLEYLANLLKKRSGSRAIHTDGQGGRAEVANGD